MSNTRDPRAIHEHGSMQDDSYKADIVGKKRAMQDAIHEDVKRQKIEEDYSIEQPEINAFAFEMPQGTDGKQEVDSTFDSEMTPVELIETDFVFGNEFMSDAIQTTTSEPHALNTSLDNLYPSGKAEEVKEKTVIKEDKQEIEEDEIAGATVAETHVETNRMRFDRLKNLNNGNQLTHKQFQDISNINYKLYRCLVNQASKEERVSTSEMIERSQIIGNVQEIPNKYDIIQNTELVNKDADLLFTELLNDEHFNNALARNITDRDEKIKRRNAGNKNNKSVKNKDNNSGKKGVPCLSLLHLVFTLPNGEKYHTCMVAISGVGKNFNNTSGVWDELLKVIERINQRVIDRAVSSDASKNTMFVLLNNPNQRANDVFLKITQKHYGKEWLDYKYQAACSEKAYFWEAFKIAALVGQDVQLDGVGNFGLDFSMTKKSSNLIQFKFNNGQSWVPYQPLCKNCSFARDTYPDAIRMAMESEPFAISPARSHSDTDENSWVDDIVRAIVDGKTAIKNSKEAVTQGVFAKRPGIEAAPKKGVSVGRSGIFGGNSGKGKPHHQHVDSYRPKSSSVKNFDSYRPAESKSTHVDSYIPRKVRS